MDSVSEANGDSVSEVILDSVSEKMTIFPDASEVKEIAKLLLELADSPRDVATTLDPGLGFVVPFWLYEKFVEVWAVRNGGHPAINADNDGENGEDDVPAADDVPETPARRKPGRPRKES